MRRAPPPPLVGGNVWNIPDLTIEVEHDAEGRSVVPVDGGQAAWKA